MLAGAGEPRTGAAQLAQHIGERGIGLYVAVIDAVRIDQEGLRAAALRWPSAIKPFSVVPHSLLVEAKGAVGADEAMQVLVDGRGDALLRLPLVW